MAAGTEAGVNEIWDAAAERSAPDCEAMARKSLHSGFTANGKIVGVGSRRPLARNLESGGNAQRTIFKVNSFVTAVALSADGHGLAAGRR